MTLPHSASPQPRSSAIGVTVLGTIFFSALGPASGTADYVTAMRTAAVSGVVILAVVPAAALTLPRRTAR